MERRRLAPVISGRLLLDHPHGIVLRIDVETCLRPPLKVSESAQVGLRRHSGELLLDEVIADQSVEPGSFRASRFPPTSCRL